jgi:uridine phosphorylase
LSDDKDYVELTYGFRAYPEIGSTATGIATLANNGVGNTTITGVGTSFNTEIANGDVIVLYDPLFANTTYAVAVVANTPTATAFEINKAIANASLGAASLKIGVASHKNSAFNNIQNENVVRYYSMITNEFDTYDTLAVKIVPLSTVSYTVPRVNDVRVIGVSA